MLLSYFGDGTGSFLEGNPFTVTLGLLLVLVVAYALAPVTLWASRKFNFITSREWASRDRVGKFYEKLIVAIGVVAFIELQPVVIGEIDKLIQHVSESGLPWQDWFAMVGTVGPVVAFLAAGKLAEKLSGLSGKVGIFLLGLLGFLMLWSIYLNLCIWAINDITWEVKVVPVWLLNFTAFLTSIWAEWGPQGYNPFWPPNRLIAVYVFVGAAIWIYTLLFADVNHTSLHNFYRDRLSKAYLIRLVGDDQVEANDTQKLSRLNVNDMPYHLINAAINLKSNEKNPFQRGRQADTFLFSKKYIGGPTTGYCETVDMEREKPHVNLGTAIAISGAAFAATAGKATIKPLAFLMALLNVRLNYWLPNPTAVAAETAILQPGSYSPSTATLMS